MSNLIITKSKIFIAALSLFLTLLFEEHTTYDFELSLTTSPVHRADFNLSLEGTVLPIIILVFVISRHLEFLISILVDQLKHISPIERLS